MHSLWTINFKAKENIPRAKFQYFNKNPSSKY